MVSEDEGSGDCDARVDGDNGTMKKVVVVLGATGTGKTKASIELAAEVLGGLGFGCEIVNCDALQCYEGSPVSTNKASEEEMAGVPHRLIGFAPADKDFTAGDFRVRAREALESTWRRGKLPILCGGSDYYAKALLSRRYDPTEVVEQGEFCSSSSASENPGGPRTDAAEGETDHERLRRVDPAMAARVHPNNERRVRRYLEIFQQTGVPPSELFRKQRRGAASKGGALIYDSCVFFLDAEDGALGPLLAARVDGMVARGMVQENRELYAKFRGGDDRGIFQGIGVKEFRRCFEDDGVGGREDLERAVAEVKANTSRLAKKQRNRALRWLRGQRVGHRVLDATRAIRAKLEGRPEGEVLSLWREDVIAPAFADVSAFLSSGRRQEAAQGGEDDDDATWRAYKCLPCGGRVLRGAVEWEAHRKSGPHRKRLGKLRKQNAPNECKWVEELDEEANTVVCSLRVTGPGEAA